MVPSALSTCVISLLTISIRFFLDTWGHSGVGAGTEGLRMHEPLSHKGLAPEGHAWPGAGDPLLTTHPGGDSGDRDLRREERGQAHHPVEQVEGSQADGLILVVQALQDEVLVRLHRLGVCPQDL